MPNEKTGENEAYRAPPAPAAKQMQDHGIARLQLVGFVGVLLDLEGAGFGRLQ